MMKCIPIVCLPQENHPCVVFVVHRIVRIGRVDTSSAEHPGNGRHGDADDYKDNDCEEDDDVGDDGDDGDDVDTFSAEHSEIKYNSK